MTTREIAARVRQLLRETQASARAMVQEHGPPAELDRRADRAQMLLLRPPLDMLAEQLEQQADQEEKLLAANMAYLDRLAQESQTFAAPPPAREPETLRRGRRHRAALAFMRASLKQVGVEVRVELVGVDPRQITLRLSGPLQLHAAVRELLAEPGPLAGVLGTVESN